MNNYRAQNDNKGFTLIEVMMASCILAVGLLALLNLMTVSVHGRRQGKDITIANNIAKRLIETAKTVKYTTLPDQMKTETVSVGGSAVFTYNAPTVDAVKKSLESAPFVYVKQQTVLAANKLYTLKLTESKDIPATGLVSVQVDVSWSAMGKAHSVSYTTYINQ